MPARRRQALRARDRTRQPRPIGEILSELADLVGHHHDVVLDALGKDGDLRLRPGGAHPGRSPRFARATTLAPNFFAAFAHGRGEQPVAVSPARRSGTSLANASRSGTAPGHRRASRGSERCAERCLRQSASRSLSSGAPALNRRTSEPGAASAICSSVVRRHVHDDEPEALLQQRLEGSPLSPSAGTETAFSENSCSRNRPGRIVVRDGELPAGDPVVGGGRSRFDSLGGRSITWLR